MDNLAHTLVGAALGEAGLKRRTPLAMPTLLIGANLPDVDVVALLFSSGLSFRRGWTHGILAIVVLPLLLTAAVMAWDRWVRRPRAPEAQPADSRQLLILSYVAILTHPFLDWLNSYGMRWLMPFDGTWFYGDALFIVDPWLWAILLGGVVLARARRGVRAGRGTVALAGAYIALMLIANGAGTLMVRRALDREGLRFDEMMIGPVAVNPNRRDVVLRRGDQYYRGTLRWLPRPRLVVGSEAQGSNRDHPAAELASRYPEAREFLVWSRFPIYDIESFESGYRVVLDDFRYTDGVRHSWAAVEILIRDGTPREGTFTISDSETAEETPT